MKLVFEKYDKHLDVYRTHKKGKPAHWEHLGYFIRSKGFVHFVPSSEHDHFTIAEMKTITRKMVEIRNDYTELDKNPEG